MFGWVVCLPEGESAGAGRLFGDLIASEERFGTVCISVSEEVSEDCNGG